MLRRKPVSARRSVQALTAICAVLLLASCTNGGDGAPATSQPSVEATPSGTATPTGPALVPDGTADDNLPLFTQITQQVWASDQRASGRAYIDALVAAGFDRGAMQVTEDQTTVGNPVESLQFSVRWGSDKCLIGQVGPSTGEPVTAVVDQLGEGRCLIGKTRPIDW